jgi:hypothetical protein
MSLHTARGSAVPAGIDVHLPGVEGRLQLRQAPVQAVSQHRPSTQKFDWHSLPAPQGWPLSFGPHAPFTQACPTSQSALLVQWLVQAPVTHRNGLQVWMPCGRHVPSPSQVPAVLRRVPVHEGGMHWVSAAYLAQLPKPSQAPVLPQLAAPMSLQMPRGSAAPRSSGQQVPMRWSRLHETQPPWQATLQQTPSAQKPDAQSSAVLQGAPFIFLPQLPFTHCWPVAHWLVSVHDWKHAPAVPSQAYGAQIAVGLGLHWPLPSQA